MFQFMIRAAQAAFVQAGYERDQASELAHSVVDWLINHLPACKERYQIDDEIELAYLVARDMVQEVDRSGPISLIGQLVT